MGSRVPRSPSDGATRGRGRAARISAPLLDQGSFAIIAFLFIHRASSMQSPSLPSPSESPPLPSSTGLSGAPIELCDTVLSRDLMTDPVLAADGFTYNRPEITHWLLTNNTSPKTSEPLENKSLVPNMYSSSHSRPQESLLLTTPTHRSMRAQINSWRASMSLPPLTFAGPATTTSPAAVFPSLLPLHQQPHVFPAYPCCAAHPREALRAFCRRVHTVHAH